MEYKVVSLQNISSQCIVCGQDSPLSLHGHFYNLENGDLYACLQPLPEHQSYPGRMHGGMASAIIDEVGGRAMNSTPARARGDEPFVFGVTMDLRTRFRKPTPYGEALYCVARMTRETTRFMDAAAYLYTMDGTLCVEGTVRYMRLTEEEIEGGTPLSEKDWHPDPLPKPDVVEIAAYPVFKDGK